LLAYDDTLADRARDALAGEDDVRERKMTYALPARRSTSYATLDRGMSLPGGCARYSKKMSSGFRASTDTIRAPHAVRATDTLEQRVARVEYVLAESHSGDRLVGDLRGELAEVAAQAERRGARLMHVVGELEKRLDGIEVAVNALDVSSITASWHAELQALEQRLRKELPQSVAPAAGEMHHASTADLQQLVDRLDDIEQARDALSVELSDLRESAAADRAALNERLVELAAQVVAQPELGPAEDDDSPADWPSPRAYVQLMVAVEGLQMRLAYHAKEVAELMGGHGVNERIEELNDLLLRLETAEETVRGERDSMLDQLDRLASRVDYRLNRLETTPAALGVETG